MKISILFTLLLIMASCGEKVKTDKAAENKVKELERILENERMAKLEFGIRTYPRPIEHTSQQIKDYGKAVAKVYNFDGSVGTGFFISPDGLFLTNDHVVEGKHCINSGCPGVKIIRDMHLNGANQVFSKFEVIAYSSKEGELDMTLLKVKIPDGGTVPFLKLDFNEDSYHADLEGRTYKVIGHPGGADLRATNVKPYKFEETQIDSLGLLIGGNSGGPLIDESTGMVIGLIKEKKTRYDKKDEGTLVHHSMGRATSIIEIAKNFRSQSIALDEMTSISSLFLEMSETYIKVDITEPAEKFSAPDKRYFEGIMLEGAPESLLAEGLRLFINYLGTEYESEVIDLMFKENTNDSVIGHEALSSLLKIQYTLGRELNYREEVYGKIDHYIDNLDESDDEMFNKKIVWASNRSGVMDDVQKRCLESDAVKENIFTVLSMCLSNTTAEGNSIILELRELYSMANIKFDFSTHLAIIYYLMNVTEISESDLDYLKKTKSEVSSEMEDIENQMTIHSLITNILIGAKTRGFMLDTF